VVAISHDRAFLRKMDRFLMVLHDGAVISLPSYDSASEALVSPTSSVSVVEYSVNVTALCGGGEPPPFAGGSPELKKSAPPLPVQPAADANAAAKTQRQSRFIERLAVTSRLRHARPGRTVPNSLASGPNRPIGEEFRADSNHRAQEAGCRVVTQCSLRIARVPVCEALSMRL